MKKKIQKPLKLNRETLTSLCYSDLRKPVGMALTDRPNLCNGTGGCPVETAWTCAVVHGQCVGY
jgi:hypothetical protein